MMILARNEPLSSPVILPRVAGEGDHPEGGGGGQRPSFLSGGNP